MFKYAEIKADSRMQAVSYVLALTDICSELKAISLSNCLISSLKDDNKKLKFKLYSAIDDCYTKFSHAYVSFLYLNQTVLNFCELSNKLDQMCNFHLIRLTVWPDDINFKIITRKLKIITEHISNLKNFVNDNKDNFIKVIDIINKDFLRVDEEFYKIIVSNHIESLIK